MQWTCRRCGLQRDDRRGSGCNDVKGQAHDWIETWEYEKQQREETLKNWINSKDSLEWKKEYENIKKYFKEETDNIQRKYKPLLENNKDKYNIFLENNKGKYTVYLENNKNKYDRLFEETEKKYNTIVEYYKKLFENKKNIIEEAENKFGKNAFISILTLLVIMIITFIIMNIITNIFLSILAVIIILILGIKIIKKLKINLNKYLLQVLHTFAENHFNNFNDNEKQELLDFINKLEYEMKSFFYDENELEEELRNIDLKIKKSEINMKEKYISIFKRIKYKYEEEITKINEDYEEEIAKINEDYEKDVKNLLKNGIEMMKASNKTYSVNEDYSYDNFDFDINFDFNFDLDFWNKNSFTFLYNKTNYFREKFIGDNDFLEKYIKFDTKE